MHQQRRADEEVRPDVGTFLKVLGHELSTYGCGDDDGHVAEGGGALGAPLGGTRPHDRTTLLQLLTAG